MRGLGKEGTQATAAKLELAWTGYSFKNLEHYKIRTYLSIINNNE